MKIALNNIILNAYQAIEKKDKKITIVLSDEKGMAVISVKDNGRGFDKSFGEKMFHPFVTGRKEGTGLGLAIAYRIVKEIHGGKIEAESEKGKGSEFRIIIPGKGKGGQNA